MVTKFNCCFPYIAVEDVQFHFNLFAEINVQPDVSFLPRPVEFEFVPDKIFAEQLTFMDMVRLIAVSFTHFNNNLHQEKPLIM